MSSIEQKNKTEETYFLTLRHTPLLNDRTKEKVANMLVPHLEPFKDDLKSLQEQVGGYIEHFNISEELYRHNIDMWIDESGKMKDKKPTFILMGPDGDMVDVIVGDCCFTRFTSSGDTLGLRPEDVDRIAEWMSTLLLCEYEGHDGRGYAYRIDWSM